MKSHIREGDFMIRKLPRGFCPAPQFTYAASVISVVDSAGLQDAFCTGHYPILQLRAFNSGPAASNSRPESCSPS